MEGMRGEMETRGGKKESSYRKEGKIYKETKSQNKYQQIVT